MDVFDDSSSAWISYTSCSSTREPVSKRSSWATTRWTPGSSLTPKRQWSVAFSTQPITSSSTYEDLRVSNATSSTTTSVHLVPALLSPERTAPVPSVVDRSLLFHHGESRNPSIFLFDPPSVINPPSHPLTWEDPDDEDYYLTMGGSSEQTPNMRDTITRLGSDEDAVRKMAVFKLQSLINDPAFAESFIQEGGLARLRWLILRSSGNTLAYSLASFARLLELDLSENRGWEAVDKEVIERVVELVVCHPLVNILRGAMAILVCIVSRPQPGGEEGSKSEYGGFQALKPAIAVYPQFLEMLVSRLSSADHALCANALQLINSLMRDVIANDPSETEWPKFIKRLQDLGVIRAVYVLMQSSALQDLAHPLLEFQAMTKVLLRRWRDIPVDLVKSEHRRIIKGIHLASNPEKYKANTPENGLAKPKHNPYKWRRLGFATETPEPDFQDMGFLGMMDLSDFVRKHQDEFQTILADQMMEKEESRCPFARASLIVTAVLYEHFEVERHDWEDSKAYMQLESRTNFERVFKPLLLHWSRLHAASLRTFFRLWTATGAEQADFAKVLELVRILVESIVGGAPRGKGIEEVEKEMDSYEVGKLRTLQMELLELTYEDVWSQHLKGVREELMSEALQFVKEQRARCLLRGAWFPIALGYRGPETGPVRSSTLRREIINGWRFVKLHESRKYLSYGDYDEILERTPEVEELSERLDLSTVSSVVSNVTATADRSSRGSGSSETTLKGLDGSQERLTTTRIVIHGHLPSKSPSDRGHVRQKPSQQSQRTHTRTTSKASNRTTSTAQTSHSTTPRETVLLTIHPQSQMVASEWLDGLLMLLNQQPITAETNKLVQMIGGVGVKVRLLNVRTGSDADEGPLEDVSIPSREGLDEDYYYRI